MLRIKGVKLEQLERRPANAETYREEAQKIMEEIEEKIQKEEQDIHCHSVKVVDEDGCLLIGVFSNRLKGDTDKVCCCRCTIRY